MNFQEKIKNTLGTYKKEKLGIIEKGIFHYRGRDLAKDHILPVKHSAENIISQYRDEFYSSLDSRIDFHKYFHHLNSSQALCINLFFPLLFEKKLNIISEFLGIQQNTIISACFEKESDIEIVNGNGRRTNFDFYIKFPDGLSVFFEIKYTESEFGKAKNDEEHREKYIRTYQPLLEGNQFIKAEYKAMDAFLGSYQIMRNLVHISDSSFVVFIYPKANQKIHQQAQEAYEKILNSKGKSRFKILLLETIVNDILAQLKTEKLRDHYSAFKDKYLNYEAS